MHQPRFFRLMFLHAGGTGGGILQNIQSIKVKNGFEIAI